jgi:hypothetical protein
MKIWKKEARKAKQVTNVDESNSKSDKDSKNQPGIEMEEIKAEKSDSEKELARILKREAKNPWGVMLAQVGVLVILLVFAITRGSSSSSSVSVVGIRGCSAGYVICVLSVR